ncbi:MULTISPECIES: hypothetical protein [Micromonospora]|uniref:hypothetical protein n=1 Tax=Micromonospora TaxID=1873 RepID=UPI0004C22D71|nr:MULTISPECIES: hypothetical protein [Micromonospora]
MTTDPTTAAVTIAAVLAAGLTLGAILAGLAARSRQLDDSDRHARAFRALLALAGETVDPVHRARLMRGAADIWDNLLPDGIALEVTAPPPLTPAYAHRLLDAYATGDPIDFSGCWVPPDIQGRVRAIVAGASETTARIPRPAGDDRLARTRTSDG